MHHLCSNCQGITKTKVSPEQMRKMFGENRPENIFEAEKILLEALKLKQEQEQKDKTIKNT